jgi:hypothetical protein
MLCLSDSIRFGNPDWQHGLQVAYDAQSLTELLSAQYANTMGIGWGRLTLRVAPQPAPNWTRSPPP